MPQRHVAQRRGRQLSSASRGSRRVNPRAAGLSWDARDRPGRLKRTTCEVSRRRAERMTREKQVRYGHQRRIRRPRPDGWAFRRVTLDGRRSEPDRARMSRDPRHVRTRYARGDALRAAVTHRRGARRHRGMQLRSSRVEQGTDTQRSSPSLHEAITLVHEAAPFPPVCMINGACLGAGFELAMACEPAHRAAGALLGTARDPGGHSVVIEARSCPAWSAGAGRGNLEDRRSDTPRSRSSRGAREPGSRRRRLRARDAELVGRKSSSAPHTRGAPAEGAGVVALAATRSATAVE